MVDSRKGVQALGYSHVVPMGGFPNELQGISSKFGPGDGEVTAGSAGGEEVFVVMKHEVAVKGDGFSDTGTDEIVVVAATAAQGKVGIWSVEGADKGRVAAITDGFIAGQTIISKVGCSARRVQPAAAAGDAKA